MGNYRVSKYNSIYRDDFGAYQRDEWTSVYDVGRVIAGSILTYDKYLVTEMQYIKVATLLFVKLGIHTLIITEVEKRKNFNKHIFERANYEGDYMHLRNIYKQIYEGKEIDLYEFANILPLCMRELLWCKFVSSEVEVYAGYEYYLHINGDFSYSTLKDIASKYMLFTEVV